jgi:small subunit ribosomal protein S21
LEVVIKIEVKDNNIEQALRVLKRKLQRDGFFKVIKLKNTYEKTIRKEKKNSSRKYQKSKKIKQTKE